MCQDTNLIFFLLIVKYFDMHSAISAVKVKSERNIARLKSQRTGKPPVAPLTQTCAQFAAQTIACCHHRKPRYTTGSGHLNRRLYRSHAMIFIKTPRQ